jgi:hypothetical protein
VLTGYSLDISDDIQAATHSFERTSHGAMSDTPNAMLLPEEGRMFAETAQPFLEGDFRRSIWVGVVD